MYISNNGKFKEGIVWWDTEIDPTADVDIFFFIHDYDKRADNPYGFKTLEIDLNKTADELFAEYNSSTRRQLRKMDTYGFEVKYFKTLDTEGIKDYVDSYNSFANYKGLQNTSVELITQLVDQHKLVVSEVYKDGILLTRHSHYVATGRTRLYQSFSTNNDLDNKTNALANKVLTHRDILYFKQEGFKVYDFGGIGNVDGDNTRFEGIIRFKKQFGGEEKILWKGTTLNGERGKAVYDKYFKH